VIPGFTDAHIHLEQYSLGLQKVDCETTDRVSALARVARRAEQSPAGDWILGHGWNQNNWVGGFAALPAGCHHPAGTGLPDAKSLRELGQQPGSNWQILIAPPDPPAAGLARMRRRTKWYII
jgi:hypothetical protein